MAQRHKGMMARMHECMTAWWKMAWRHAH